MKIFRVPLASISLLAVISGSNIQAQGLSPKFSQDIKRDVSAFVQGSANLEQQNTLQQNLTDLINRTGTDKRILSQIVSEAINSASETPGHNIQKIGRVIQTATLCAISAALAAETANAEEAVETITNAVTFQFVSLSAKGDSAPEQNLMLVTQAIAFGVGVAILDHGSDNATSLCSTLAQGTLNGTIRASTINNFDPTQTTSYACQGMIQGMIQVASINKADGAGLCQAISQGAFSATITQSAQKPDQAGIIGQAAVRGLLDGVFNSRARAKLDGKALASYAGSTYKGVKQTLAGTLPAGINKKTLKDAAFDTWSTKVYSLIPNADELLQKEIVISLYQNSEGEPELQAAITQGVIQILIQNDKATRALALLPIMAESAVESMFLKEDITYENLEPFYSTGVTQIMGAQDPKADAGSTISKAHTALLAGSLNAALKLKKDPLRNISRISEILARCGVKSSQSLSLDKAIFLKNCSSGLMDAAVNATVAEGLALPEPAMLVEGTMEGLSIGIIRGLIANNVPLEGAGNVIKAATQSAAGAAIRIGKEKKMESGQVIDFALKASRGCSSGIVKLLENKLTSKGIGSSGSKILESASNGVAMGILPSLIPAGGDTLISQQELVQFAEATTFGATRGAVFEGSSENAADYAQATSSGSVLGTIAIATHLFSKPDELETL